MPQGEGYTNERPRFSITILEPRVANSVSNKARRYTFQCSNTSDYERWLDACFTKTLEIAAVKKSQQQTTHDTYDSGACTVQ